MKEGQHFGTSELRKKLKLYYRDRGAPYPEECRDMLCGAKTRSGKPCKNDGTSYSNGRCKLHGGASTGPTTEAGRRQSAINGRNNKAKPMHS